MRFEGIGKRYRLGGPWVLHDVNVVLAPGRIVRIAGLNGSGKSTLMRLVAGVAVPTRGKVTGTLTTGYVPERFPPALPFVALDYLRHQARLRGVPVQNGVDWLERLGAAGFGRTAMRELSKGTSQKVAVAQALLADPELLVLDEAWTGLDVEARGVLEDAVRERVAAGGCVVFVDHDPARLADVTDEWWLVREGTVAIDRELVYESLIRRLVIEVEGIPSGSDLLAAAPEATELPTVDSAKRLLVRADRSDETLRRLLAIDDKVHVVAVRAARTDEGSA